MSQIFLKLKDGAILKNSEDLLYLIGAGSYSMIYFVDGTICRVTKNLKNFTKEYLEGNDYLYRISKSLIINVNQIDKIVPYDINRKIYLIKFRNGLQIEIGSIANRNLVNYFKSSVQKIIIKAN